VSRADACERAACDRGAGGRRIPESVAELAQVLIDDGVPGDLSKTIFINTGSEATEVALRMAKMDTRGYEVLRLGGSLHGITGGASSVSMAGDRKGYGGPAPGVFVIPEPNPDRPYFPGLDEEAAALANLERALKLHDMQSAGPPTASFLGSRFARNRPGFIQPSCGGAPRTHARRGSPLG
jgi:4-aminobutyrate aminotransferase-like enzyme